MIQRLSKLSKSQSFFLFGARGTGKSTLLHSWKKGLNCKYIDLLEPNIESELALNPERLLEYWLPNKTDWIVIDEIQKIPKLLDVVHYGIEKYKIKFALTGSSARKLRRGAANLLGGRAIELKLHPFTHLELKSSFNLDDVLAYGSIPSIYQLKGKDKIRALYSYVLTYLKEEVLVEQLIRKIEPYRKFLEVAAQMNGKILNYAKIARDSGIEEKSVSRYFQILDDTLLGFFLEPYHLSVRKRQSQKSKFYFFDTGVTRTLQNTVNLKLYAQTPAYGDLFEQFIILECIRLNDYFEKHYSFSYLRTKDDVEIDLIIERPGKNPVLVEIKSSTKINKDDTTNLKSISKEFKNADLLVLTNITKNAIVDGVQFMNWQDGLKKIFS
jgi:predicted AAA+ superfamily ATPase